MLEELQRKRFSPGETIFLKGEEGTCAYLIESGQVEITDPDTSTVLAHVGSGELIGEIALVDQQPRTATAKALQDVVLVQVDRELITQLLDNTAPIIHHLLNVVVRRFRDNLTATNPRPDSDRPSQTLLENAVAQKLTLLQDMKNALLDSQFVLFYQPIYRLADGKIAGFEALLRWKHPAKGLVPPMEFLGLAEETGLIKQIGLWVLEQACRDWRRLRNYIKDCEPFLSVNVSAVQLEDGLFANAAKNCQVRFGINPCELKLELTESSIITNPDKARIQLDQLMQFGNTIALDDYGTGVSVLQNLQKYRFQTIKLDQCFIREILHSSVSFELVLSTLAMIKTLQMDAVGEGIESEEISRVIRDMGCKYGQGYWFGKPMEISALDAVLPGN